MEHLLSIRQVLLFWRIIEMLMRAYPICGKVHSQGEKCPNAKAGQKEYDMLHRNREGASFYHSDQWKRICYTYSVKSISPG